MKRIFNIFMKSADFLVVETTAAEISIKFNKWRQKGCPLTTDRLSKREVRLWTEAV